MKLFTGKVGDKLVYSILIQQSDKEAFCIVANESDGEVVDSFMEHVAGMDTKSAKHICETRILTDHED